MSIPLRSDPREPSMDPEVRQALEKDRLIDITTTGRKTGLSRRKEIGFRYMDGRLYITGIPGRRGWYANLLANPEFTFHLKQSIRRDLPARAWPIVDKDARHAVFAAMKERFSGRPDMDVEEWVGHSPLVEVELQGQASS